jgi:hypothetical protein
MQTRLVLNPDDSIAGPQFTAAAIHATVLKHQLRLLDKICPQKHPVSGHPHNVPLQTPEISEEDLNPLLLAFPPTFRDPLVPISGLLIGSREHGIARLPRRRPMADKIAAPIRRC